MIFPEKLQKGDIIGLIAPSSPITKEEAFLCEKFIKDRGYQVKLGNCIYRSIHGYCAGTGEERAKEINKMFQDKEIKAIFCTRGGYSSCHMMDKIDYEMIRKNPKIFVGYSDVTNLNVVFNQRCDLVTFHGPMVKSNLIYRQEDFTKKSFQEAIYMEKELLLKNPPGEELKVLIGGIAEGMIVGGNLSLLTSMIGTPYEVNTRGKILFIEEVEEKIHHIDRMMYQLKYAKKLEQAEGILFGDFTNCENFYDKNYKVIDLLKDVLKGYKKPVMYNIRSGHCFPMVTIPLGSKCIVNTNDKEIKFVR